MAVNVNAVAVVALMNKNNEVLLATQPCTGPWHDAWAVPGGKVQPNETPLRAARREVREELGVVVEHLIPIGKFDLNGWTIHVYVALQWHGIPDQREGQLALAWASVPAMLTYHPYMPSMPMCQDKLLDFLITIGAPAPAPSPAADPSTPAAVDEPTPPTFNEWLVCQGCKTTDDVAETHWGQTLCAQCEATQLGD